MTHYHQNLGIFQWVWLHQKTISLRNLSPPQPKSFFENTMGNPFLIFVCDDRNAPQKNWNRNINILISNLLSESILDFGEWSNWKYANYGIWCNWRNVSMTTSQNPKMIPKADLKWACPYFYSKFFCGALRSS